jgi:hypothetical protein
MSSFSALRSIDDKIRKQYSKAHKEMWKALGKLRLSTFKIEEKYCSNKSNQFLSWEHVYKTTKMRTEARRARQLANNQATGLGVQLV